MQPRALQVEAFSAATSQPRQDRFYETPYHADHASPELRAVLLREAGRQETRHGRRLCCCFSLSLATCWATEAGKATKLCTDATFQKDWWKIVSIQLICSRRWNIGIKAERPCRPRQAGRGMPANCSVSVCLSRPDRPESLARCRNRRLKHRPKPLFLTLRQLAVTPCGRIRIRATTVNPTRTTVKAMCQSHT